MIECEKTFHVDKRVQILGSMSFIDITKHVWTVYETKEESKEIG